MFVQSGFALPQALKEISSSINNLEMKEDLNAVNIEVKNGLPLSKAIMQSVYIPDIYKETFASGEKTGSLKADLLKTIDLINEHFEEESKKVISKITMTISLFVSAINFFSCIKIAKSCQRLLASSKCSINEGIIANTSKTA